MSDAPATSAAFHALLDLMREAEQKFASAGLDLADVLDGYRWVFSITQVALDTQVWADDARPLFVPIVGPYKKWGGDNSDAYYYYAPIDPARSYRVRGTRGDAAYLSLTVYGGPRDGNYSVRADKTSNDEIGLLIDGFNHMLEQVELRDAELPRTLLASWYWSFRICPMNSSILSCQYFSVPLPSNFRRPTSAFRSATNF